DMDHCPDKGVGSFYPREAADEKDHRGMPDPDLFAKRLDLAGRKPCGIVFLLIHAIVDDPYLLLCVPVAYQFVPHGIADCNDPVCDGGRKSLNILDCRGG